MEVYNGNDDLEKALWGDSDGVEEQLLSAKEKGTTSGWRVVDDRPFVDVGNQREGGKDGGVSARGRGGNGTNRGSGAIGRL